MGVGAVGGMTLAVMIRASLGHTGQPLRAGLSGTLIFSALLVATLARIVAVVSEANADLGLQVAAFAWMVAFIGFAVAFGPALCRRRKTRAAQ